MSKKTTTRADFNWLPDGIEIPVALWKAPKAFIVAKDARYYLNGIHFTPCGQVWATNGHIGITIDLPHAFADKPVPSWFPANGVTFYPPKLLSGTYTTRAYPTDEKASVSSDGKISTGGDPVMAAGVLRRPQHPAIDDEPVHHRRGFPGYAPRGTARF